MKSLICLMLLTFAGFASAQITTWDETYFSETYTPHQVQFLWQFTYSQDIPNPWEVSALDHFYVTGSSTQEPSWRTRFQYLANNQWNETDYLGDDLDPGDVVRNYRLFYTRTGTNSHERIYPEAYATRTLDEKLTESFYFTVNE